MSERRFISVQCVGRDGRKVTDLRFGARDAFAAAPAKAYAGEYQHGSQRKGELWTQDPSCQRIQPTGRGVCCRRFFRAFDAAPDVFLETRRQPRMRTRFAQQCAKRRVLRIKIVCFHLITGGLYRRYLNPANQG